MAKRFTDTTKWKRPWFRKLDAEAKILWLYLCDECDHAGIFIADFELASFQLGFEVDENTLRNRLGDKVVKIDADKYFIPSFFEFQYGDCKDGFRAKQSALKALRKLGLLEEDSDCLIDLRDTYLSVQGHLPECRIISKSTSNTGDARGEKPESPPERPKIPDPEIDLEQIYAQYPRRPNTNKGKGMARLKREVTTPTDLAEAILAARNYREYCERCRTEKSFIKQFSTWAACWREWIEPEVIAADPIQSTFCGIASDF